MSSFPHIAAAGLAMLTAIGASGAEGPAGTTLYVKCSAADAEGVSETELKERPRRELPERIAVFDVKRLPSDYKTCYTERAKHRKLRIVRPYDGARFPRNIAPPEFRWEDGESRIWLLTVKAPGWAEPLRVYTTEKRWRPDAATWEAVKRDAGGGEVELRVFGGGGGEGGVGGDIVRFAVSEHPCDPVIVYRMVTPLFHGNKTPDIHWRDVSTFETGLFYPGKGIYCSNCHSFPVKPVVKREDMKAAIAVRDQLAGLNNKRILGLFDFSSKKGKTRNINSFFMSWDPEGNYIAVTGGDKVRVRPLITLETQEFYVINADILIVNFDTLHVRPLRGASDSDYMESMPAWSPDGSQIVFARALEMGPAFEERKFDLYRVPAKGGVATPIRGASHNDYSNYAPRFSPDGKWIIYNRADYSSLVAPSADLWIVSTEPEADPRKLECNVPEAMDSHHSFSSNSRWLVFASKRDDGIFARLYITEIDDEGRASPPVELPATEKTMMCYNVPEFLRYKFDLEPDDIMRATDPRE